MIDVADSIRKAFMTLGWASGAASLTEGIYGGLGAIVMLHRLGCGSVSPLGVNRHLSMDPAFLESLIVALKAEGYDFVSMDQVVARLDAPQASDRRFISITLDDGYRDNLELGLPVFRKHQVPFAVYVAPGLVDGSVILWWEVLERLIAERERIELPAPAGIEVFDTSTSRGEAKGLSEPHLPSHRRRWPKKSSSISSRRSIVPMVSTGPRSGRRRSWGGTRLDASPLIRCAPSGRTASITIICAASRLKRPSRKWCARPMSWRRASASVRPTWPIPTAIPRRWGRVRRRWRQKAGFVSAVTTRHGTIQPAHAAHRFALPRISLNGRFQKMRYVQAMVSGFTTPLANRGQRLVTVD